MTDYIAQTVPAEEIQVSGTTLFHIAAQKLGDATQWNRIAELNGLTDPWIGPLTTILIPRAGASNGGILTPTGG